MKDNKWNIYFMSIAREVSKNSKCLSRQIGAILVRDNTVVSTGYNGPPRGLPHCDERPIDFFVGLNYNNIPPALPADFSTERLCPRRLFGYKSGEGLHLCQAGHAERNALIQAARNGICTKGATLVCYCGLPCKDCMIEIINAGISKIVCLDVASYDKYSQQMVEESGIEVTKINPLEFD